MEFHKNTFTFAAFLSKEIRDVAQPGSAHVWGAWGRKFESCHPDKIKLKHNEKPVNNCIYGLFNLQAISNLFKKYKSFVS